MSGSVSDNRNLPGFPVTVSQVPSQNPRALPLPPFAWDSVAAWSIDLTETLQSDQISSVQSVYIDNSKNSGAVTILTDVVGQVITIPGSAQGYFPLLFTGAKLVVSSTIAAGQLTKLYLLNVPVQPATWNSSSQAGASNVNISGQTGANPLIVAFPAAAPQHVIVDSAALTDPLPTQDAADVAPGTVFAAQIAPLTQAVVNGLSSAYATGTIQPLTQSAAGSLNVGQWFGAGNNASSWAGVVSSGGAPSAGSAGIIGGTYNATTPVLTSGNGASLQLDTSGNLLVNVTELAGVGTAGSALQVNIHGQSGTTATLKTADQTQAYDTAGSLFVDTEGQKQTYRASADFSPASTTLVLFQLKGSATKTIRIRRVCIDGIATTAGQANPQFIRASSTASGGTTHAIAIGALDTNNSAATAVADYFTGAAVPGTTVAVLDSFIIPMPAASNLPSLINQERSFSNLGGQSLVLRGASDFFQVVNAAGSNPAGSNYDIMVEWTEE